MALAFEIQPVSPSSSVHTGASRRVDGDGAVPLPRQANSAHLRPHLQVIKTSHGPRFATNDQILQVDSPVAAGSCSRP